MPKLPGVNHLAAVRALEKIGFIHNPTGQAYHAERWLADGANTARKPGKRLYDGEYCETVWPLAR